MRLRALTGLERQRVLDELEELRARIEELKGLLASDERILAVVLEELEEIREKFGDERRTEITGAVEGLSHRGSDRRGGHGRDRVPPGYVKRTPVTQYRAQRRGGQGREGHGDARGGLRRALFVASTHAYILFFTNRGRVHWLKVWELPQLGRAARGKALVNVLQLTEGEKVQATLPVRSFDETSADDFVLLCTRKGVIKKTPLDAYSNPRRGGIIAINLADDDELIGARSAPPAPRR